MDGVIILSLKKPSYACSAFNLALSIKYFNPKIHITLISDGEHLRHYQGKHFATFDWIKEIKKEDYQDQNGFQPGFAKLNLAKYSTYENTLYVDADSLCLQNIQPLFDKLKGQKFKSNVTKDYTQWTDAESYKEFFGIDQGVSINSSWIYFENDQVFNRAFELYKRNFPLEKVSPVWGNTYPDELFFNGALNLFGINPAIDFDVMFFGNNIDPRTLTQIEEQFYFFTLYGNRTTVRKIYTDWYDKLMFKICESKGIEHLFKAHSILVGKHLSK